MKYRALVAFALAALLQPQTALSIEDHQRRFEEALESINRDPELSVEMLRTLSSQTNSIRVKLELARALYISGRLHEAKEAFGDVLAQLPANAPAQVRVNVERFLAEINKKLNPIRFGFSLVRDSNPTQSTEEQQIRLFGVDFTYRPLKKAKKEYGLRLTADGSFRPNFRSEVVGYLAHTKYESSRDTKNFITPEYRYLLSQNYRLWGRIGYEFEEQNNKSLRHGKFVGLRKFSDFPKYRLSTMLDARTIWNHYPDYTDVDGRTADGQVLASYRAHQNLRLIGGLATDQTWAKDDQYASSTYTHIYGFALSNLPGRLEVTATQRDRKRKYDEPTHFFGYKREDIESTLSLSIQKSDLYILGVKPALEFVQERRRSNIPIVEYARDQVYLTGTRVF